MHARRTLRDGLRRHLESAGPILDLLCGGTSRRHAAYGEPRRVVGIDCPIAGRLERFRLGHKIMRLSVGERVFLYTDGVVESGLVDGRVATNYDLQNVLKDSADLDLTEQVAAIIAGTARRDRGRVTDDATIIAFEVLSESAS